MDVYPCKSVFKSPSGTSTGQPSVSQSVKNFVLAFLKCMDCSILAFLKCKDSSVWTHLNVTYGSVWFPLNLLPLDFHSRIFLAYHSY